MVPKADISLKDVNRVLNQFGINRFDGNFVRDNHIVLCLFVGSDVVIWSWMQFCLGDGKWKFAAHCLVVSLDFYTVRFKSRGLAVVFAA